jgi:hypothetical protein
MRAVALVSVVAIAALARPAAGEDEIFDYVTQPGDTCDKIALKNFGNASRIDLVHATNPQLGPPPHGVFKPGTVLHLRRSAPDAKLSFVRNHVDAFTPGQHAGQANEPLLRGHRVSTYDASGAEIIFRSNAVLQLGEQTLVVILGSTGGSVSKKEGDDTTLMNGSLRSHLAGLAGRAPPQVSTPAGHKVELGEGDAQVTVDPKKTTRLAVYKGTSAITAQRKTVSVPSGFGSKAEQGSAPTPPRPLPPPPRWIVAPPAVVFASAPVDVHAEFSPGTGAGPAPKRWHVQLARDDRFNDVIVDAKVDVSVTKLDAKGLAAGRYLARVSAIDDDGFEGAPGVLGSVLVTPLAVKRAGAQAASVAVPAGLFCGIDGAPLAMSAGAIAFTRGPAHTLRCASGADGDDATETALPAESLAPLAVTTEVHAAGEGTVRVVARIADAERAPLAAGRVEVVATDGAIATPLVPSATPGSYETTVRARAGQRFRLHFVVNGIDAIDSDTIALAAEAPPPSLTEPSAAVTPSVALFGGTSIVANSLGTGPILGAEVAAHWRAWSGMRLALGLRGSWERHALSGDARCATPGIPASPACTTTFAYDATDDAFAIALPMSLRFDDGRFVPYLGVAPIALVLRTETAFHTSPEGSRTDHGFALGAALFGGLDLRLSPRDAIFIEAWYRATGHEQELTSDRARTAFIATIGYRFGR